MIPIETVVFKISGVCNIDCRYCYVYNMGDSGWTRLPKRMSRETCDAAAMHLGRLARAQDRQFVVVLHGGEPLLLGPRDLEFTLSTLRQALPTGYPISIQTNGVLISDEILNI